MIVINGLNPTADIELYIEELDDEGFPASAIVACLIRYQEAGPLLLPLLTRAADDDDIDKIGERRFSRGLHIMAGARDKRAFAPLLRLLRRPDDRSAPLLVDTTDTLPSIVIGVFDGDSEELFKAILDKQVDEFHRAAMLNAASYLTWEGRIARERMIRFLKEFATAGAGSADEAPRSAWAMSIGLLGVDELKAAALSAWGKGLIAYANQDDFLQFFAEATARPDDSDRFDQENLGHLDNVLEILEQLFELDNAYDEIASDEGMYGDDLRAVPERAPAINPMRHVGRNDPCPCGSGKKAKRCCLAA